MREGVKEKGQPDTPKVGVYICHCGGNISGEVEVTRLREEAERLPQVVVAADNPFMCSDAGQELIIQDIQKGRVNRVVVASCAPSLHETTFRRALERAGLNPYLYEQANIREQVSWVHHGPEATRKAFRLIAAAVAKARGLKPLEPIRLKVTPHVTVVGGGVSGLKAALEMADQGLEVTLLEASLFLGGQVAALDKLSPTGESAKELLMALLGRILAHPRIKVFTCATVTAAEGFAGNFHLKVLKRPLLKEERPWLSGVKAFGPDTYVEFKGLCPFPPPEREEAFSLNTGAIVVATGYRPYQPKKGEYGYQEQDCVLTLPEMIQVMARSRSEDGPLTVNGRPIKSIALIHCVGSRQIPGLHEVPDGERLNPYCSRVCCTATLKLANAIKDRYPKMMVYELYRDIRTYGRHQEPYYVEAGQKGVLFFRFEPENLPRVGPSTDQEYAMTVAVKDTLMAGEEIELPVDLVVLAVGMEPNEIRTLEEGLKLPLGEDGFLLEVHPKLRPVEISVNGVFLAGTCQAPMDVTESCSASTAAAAKACSLLSKGYVEWDPFVAEVEEERCTGCGQCRDACIKEGVILLEEVQTKGGSKTLARVNPALCLGCGVCVPACPEQAIQVAGWTLDQYQGMVEAILEHDLLGGIAP